MILIAPIALYGLALTELRLKNSIVSVIAKVVALFASQMTQFAVQINTSLFHN